MKQNIKIFCIGIAIFFSPAANAQEVEDIMLLDSPTEYVNYKVGELAVSGFRIVSRDGPLEEIIIKNSTVGGAIPNYTLEFDEEFEETNEYGIFVGDTRTGTGVEITEYKLYTATLSWKPNESDFRMTDVLTLELKHAKGFQKTYELPVEIMKGVDLINQELATTSHSVSDPFGRYIINIKPKDPTRAIYPGRIVLTEYLLRDCSLANYEEVIVIPEESNVDIHFSRVPPIFPRYTKIGPYSWEETNNCNSGVIAQAQVEPEKVQESLIPALIHPQAESIPVKNMNDQINLADILTPTPPIPTPPTPTPTPTPTIANELIVETEEAITVEQETPTQKPIEANFFKKLWNKLVSWFIFPPQ